MCKNVKISVITVCYNAATTLDHSIVSVLNQTYPNIEYIIIDGGSTDGTVDIIKKYSDRLAYWVSEPDNGIYDAMNKGVKKATGDYVLFLGADDKLIDGSLEKMIAGRNSYNSILYGNVMTYPGNKRYGGRFSRFTMSHRNICHQSMLFPTEILKESPYDCKYRLLADYAFNIKNFRKTKFEYTPVDVAVFNITGISHQIEDSVFMNDWDNLIKENLGITVYGYCKLRRILVKIAKRIIKI